MIWFNDFLYIFFGCAFTCERLLSLVFGYLFCLVFHRGEEKKWKERKEKCAEMSLLTLRSVLIKFWWENLIGILCLIWGFLGVFKRKLEIIEIKFVWLAFSLWKIYKFYGQLSLLMPMPGLCRCNNWSVSCILNLFVSKNNRRGKNRT